MEENFYKDDFEKFLQEQANNHKMFPSEKVWGNIHDKLHQHKNWPALTIAALGFLAAIIAIGIYFSPKPNIFATKSPELQVAQTKAPPSSSLIGSVTNNTNRKATAWTFDKVDESFKTKAVSAAEEATNDQEQIPVAPAKQDIRSSSVVRVSAAIKRRTDRTEKLKTNTFEELQRGSVAEPSTEAPEQVVDFNAQKNSVIYGKEPEKSVSSISIVTSASAKRKSKLFTNKFSYLVYITPSASFRRLKEDGEFIYQKLANPSGPVDISKVADVNRVVRHAPGTGAEAGVSFRYNLTSKLKVTTGVQFNVRQYSMEAFVANGEPTTIALQRTSGIDSVVKYSYYRTSNGHASTELVNRYYQLAVPIGLEWEVIGSRHIGFNVAAAIQPTYNLNTNSYLISTNFKNYTESGSILRNWNINTNIEAFVNFKNGDYRWQIGPQFRYQQLSSFIKAYPIKENLLDYGLKIGVSKVIQ